LPTIFTSVPVREIDVSCDEPVELLALPLDSVFTKAPGVVRVVGEPPTSIDRVLEVKDTAEAGTGRRTIPIKSAVRQEFPDLKYPIVTRPRRTCQPGLLGSELPLPIEFTGY
jgi:hypothetical protein